jgi:hypothetical protein
MLKSDLYPICIQNVKNLQVFFGVKINPRTLVTVLHYPRCLGVPAFHTARDRDTATAPVPAPSLPQGGHLRTVSQPHWGSGQPAALLIDQPH